VGVARPVDERRPGLDGVRALAVGAVAVYHFGGGSRSWLPGGYLGVDAFFVLSGYLITGLLLTEYGRTARIDLAAFWARRARRLLPALAVLVLAVSAWIWWAVPPEYWPRRRGDLLWTIGYLANWHSIQAGEDYFAGYDGASPLRHAWSLAVEEQFYLVWPALVLLLMAIGRRRCWGRRLLLGFTLATLAGSVLAGAVEYQPGNPNRAYYGTDGRMHELAVGALLALGLPRLTRLLRGQRAAGARRVLLTVALAGLGLAALRLSDAGPTYYRGGSLAVCLAVAVLVAEIETRPDGALGRALSLRPLVWLGRISYGVYLWHWPITVALPLAGDRWDPLRQGARVLLTLGIAAASFVLVERPVQTGRWLRRPVRVAAVTAATVALSVGTSLTATALPAGYARAYAVRSDHPCPGERTDRLVSCARTGAVAAPVDLMLLGDSVARSLAPGLDLWAGQTGHGWVQSAWQRCPPTGLLVLPGGVADLPARVCVAQARDEISRALHRWRPRIVIATEFWTHHQHLLVDGRVLLPGTAEQLAAAQQQYDQLADQVAAVGGLLVLIRLVPGGQSLGSVLAADRPAGSARPPVPGNQFVPGWNRMLDQVAMERPGRVGVVDIADLVCDPDGRCPAVRDGVLIRTDGVHYSTDYSRLLVPQLMRRIRSREAERWARSGPSCATR
jgi:peptidoglycan/LPS O-acetylase OafA/YrhL